MASINSTDAKRIKDLIMIDAAQAASEIFGLKFPPYQSNIIRKIFTCDRLLLLSGHGIGKSMIFAIASILFQLLHQSSCYSIIITPTHRQAVYLMNQVNKIWHKNKWNVQASIGQKQWVIDPKTDKRIVSFSTNAPERVQGYHADHLFILVDEATGVDDEIYESISSLMSTPHTKVVFASNPTRHNWYHDLWNRSSWDKIQISTIDAYEEQQKFGEQHISTEFLHQFDYDQKVRQIRILGEWLEESEYDVIQIPRARDPQIEKHGCAIGLDIAGAGRDKTIITIIKDYDIKYCGPITNLLQKDEFNRKFIALLNKFNIDRRTPTYMYWDASGQNIELDLPQELDFIKLTGVKFVANGSKHKYRTLRSEYYEIIMNSIDKIGISAMGSGDNFTKLFTTIQNDFRHCSRFITDRGQIDYKKDHSASPDYADSMCLAFAADRHLPELTPDYVMQKSIERTHNTIRNNDISTKDIRRRLRTLASGD